MVWGFVYFEMFGFSNQAPQNTLNSSEGRTYNTGGTLEKKTWHSSTVSSFFKYFLKLKTIFKNPRSLVENMKIKWKIRIPHSVFWEVTLYERSTLLGLI